MANVKSRDEMAVAEATIAETAIASWIAASNGNNRNGAVRALTKFFARLGPRNPYRPRAANENPGAQ